ncbi:nucleotidyltransferase domain-containing protein [Ramlibacter albus]|uniref:MarR family transcriptional regulator n=1 Tax=Ramlibacter albus TaxID=2079448 RepID=A0A923ME68_9BURK|nr:nucleotidyltransferase domain-containing protein [Ramlibacter albus]MBC5767372.1 MarR family transcriptional regulator [Ramlibacter albus]
MQQSASALLFPEYRRRVLGLLLLRPELALHGREIARRTGLPAGTITRELTKLADAGLLNRERRGNQQVYSANTGSSIHSELASILRKTSGLTEVLQDALLPILDRLQLAFVFGSVAQGRETAGSDVDVMIVGDIDFRSVVAALHPAEEVIGRPINVQVLSVQEFRTKRRTAFMKDVLSKPKLYLLGNDDELEELVGDQP